MAEGEGAVGEGGGACCGDDVVCRIGIRVGGVGGQLDGERDGGIELGGWGPDVPGEAGVCGHHVHVEMGDGPLFGSWFWGVVLAFGVGVCGKGVGEVEEGRK